MANNSKPSSDVLSILNESLVQYHGFWCNKSFLQGIEAMRAEFEAHPDDIILASSLKTGTTWIKALVYAILSCKQYDLNDPPYPLNRVSPHELVPNLEMQLYGPFANLTLESVSLFPRVFHTHVPYQALPDSIKSSGCKIIYLARNPKDTFVSLWEMVINKLNNKNAYVSKEKALESFCRGVYHTGPFANHVASYWREKSKHNILCLTYEDLVADPVACIEVLSDFMGCWWVKEEDMSNISNKCSFKSLSQMEANKTGEINLRGLSLRNDSFFREGKVGGWKNLLTADMNAEMDKMIEQKLSVFEDFPQFKYQLEDGDVKLHDEFK
ncbi:cytosolic sulfotransferase 6-like [Cryptomeria japonica]|uniref:cytosolic sulfotransferase 6-like n=1 Tax=Cryptomeria japonica TaxID=3369 RepID=UPI0027D9F0C1|nr:cytosolic sulfotransferase 6-like [Cryptomeria japonica]